MSWLKSLFSADDNRPQSLSSAKTILDVVIGAASLASQPQEIDPILANVRAITARLRPGQPVSQRDGLTLLRVYLEIEQYLTTRETLRSFTRDELRRRLDANLRASLETYETAHSKRNPVASS
jgi:hypothetical protein